MTSYRRPTEEEFRKALKTVGPTQAGSGDSPYTQEYLDKCFGKKGNRRKGHE